MSTQQETRGPIAKTRRRKSRAKAQVAEVFAYPHDDTGLPLPVDGFPPVPDALLAYARRTIKQAVSKTLPDQNLEALMNPYCPIARAFRLNLKNARE